MIPSEKVPPYPQFSITWTEAFYLEGFDTIKTKHFSPSRVWMCLYASMYMDMLCICLGWLCSLRALHRGWMTYWLKGLIYSDEASGEAWGLVLVMKSTPLSSPSPSLRNTSHMVRHPLWKLGEQKFWKFYFVICFFEILCCIPAWQFFS